MRADGRILVFGLVVLTLAACDAGTPSPPAAPTLTPPAIRSVSISGVPASPNVGLSVQLKALVTLPDGTPLDATSQVAWQSTDATVATVSTTGLLMVAGPGDTDVTATLQNVRGTAHVAVSKPNPLPVRYDISGVVHESAPTENVMLAGATVGIHFVECPTCPHDNQSTTTDDAGRFTLPGLDTVGFELVVSKPGYETASYAIAQLPRDQHPTVALVPAAQTTTFTGRLCSTLVYSPPTPSNPACTEFPVELRHLLPVHRPGTLAVGVRYTYSGDYSSNSLNLEIQCGSVVTPFQVLIVSYTPQPVKLPALPVPAACVYTVKVFNYRHDHLANYAFTDYQIEIDHPK